MQLTNYHCHTQFCDGRAEAEDFVKEAVRKRFSKLGFSSHSPVPYASVWNMKAENMSHYIKEILRLKDKYRDVIEIFLGMEADYIPGICSPKDDAIQTQPFDFVIGSVHFLDKLADGTPWTIDGSPEWFDQGLKEIFDGDIKQYVRRFTDVSCEMISNGGFQIVGHIDKMFQHGYRYLDLQAPWYRGCVAQLLETANNNGLMVEINTKSYHKLGFFYPHQDFFRMLATLKNRITINSDTHVPALIDIGFAEARNALIHSGIDEVYDFIDNEWQPVSLVKYQIQTP